MAVKNTAQVVIGGKIITLGGYESEEYFQKVASYINNKIAELSEMPGYTRQPVETKHTLLCFCYFFMFLSKFFHQFNTHLTIIKKKYQSSHTFLLKNVEMFL